MFGPVSDRLIGYVSTGISQHWEGSMAISLFGSSGNYDRRDADRLMGYLQN